MSRAQLINSGIGLAGALCAGASQMWPHYQLLLLPIAAFLGGLACPQIAKASPPTSIQQSTTINAGVSIDGINH